MNKLTPAYIVLVLFLILSGISFFWDSPVFFLEQLIGENIFLGSVLFTSLMFLATVVAPITILPLVPLISPVLGPFLTAMLSIVGWTLGAVVAFLIARHAGRPLLSKFVSLKSLEKYEKYLGEEARFMSIVVLRLVVPVDILSYALGLFCTISLTEYTLATVIGVSYFSFVFSYLGEAAIENNMLLFMSVIIMSLIIFGLGWWYMIKKIRKSD